MVFIVLSVTQGLLTLTGHSGVRTSLRRPYTLYRGLVLLCMSALSQPFFCHIIAPDTDFDSSTLFLSTLLTELVAMLNCVLLMWKRTHLLHLLATIQSDIDTNQAHNIAHFMRAQRQSNAVSVVNIVAITVPVGGYVITPLVLMAFHKLNGSYRSDMVKLPYDMELLFDTHSTMIGYVLGYVYQSIGAIFSVLQILASDGLFIGGCLFAAAYQRDLREYCADLDAEFAQTGDVRALRAHLVVAVRRHWRFNRWMRQFEQISSGLIFIQIGLSAVMVAIFTFLCEYQFDALYMLMSAFLTMEMFIFCYIATEVTAAISSTGVSLYASHWYNYPIELQPYVAMMCQQMQQAKYMHGLGVLDCSLEFFVKVMKFIGSIIAMLQNLK